MKQGASQFWLTGTIALCCLITAGPTRAQIVPDATLPNNSQVTTQGNTSLIEGGTAAGTNLFHSFRDFSVTAGTGVQFNNAATIQNIITRVTGTSISNIDGLIRANGTANLFLINPNGIIFGPNASLQIGGSFLASTSESLVFEDGSQFSAINPQATPLLAINVPIGLQFGNKPTSILVQGNGHNLSMDDQEAIIRENRPQGVSVTSGKTLAIVGGNVTLEGGNLTATGGRIELGSVANGAFVNLNIIASGFALGYESVQEFQDIQLFNAASIDASGAGGEIYIQGRNVAVRDGSAVLAVVEGTELGGLLNLKASESVELIGIAPDGQFRSGLLSQTQAEGKAGDVMIEAGQLIVNGGQAGIFTFAGGDTGNFSINVKELVDITNSESDNEFIGGLFNQVKPDATGDGGDLTVETRRLIVRNGAQIATSTFGDGRGGNLLVQASQSVELFGRGIEDGYGGIASGLFAQSESTQESGDLRVETGLLILRDGAEISTTIFGSKNAGNLFIRAFKGVELSGISNELGSGIIAFVNEGEATGSGGNITIETPRLTVRDGGQISATTFGAGSGGTVTVRGIQQEGVVNVAEAEFVELIGTDFFGYPSSLTATTEGTGVGGNVRVDAKRVIIREGGQIATSTFVSGSSGTITVNASEVVELSGTGIFEDSNEIFPSGILARTREGSGDAGSLEINTNQLIISNGATATVSSSLSTGAAAGNLTVNAPKIRLDNGIITAETRAGSEGNIFLQTQDLQLRRNSNITTNATGPATGGNIFINTDTIAALENSDISANAEQDFGGKVQISTQGIFRQGFLGTDVNRDSSAISSDITATSQLGPEFDGTVAITNPDIDPAQGLVDLPEDFAQDEIPENACAAAGKGSQFINSGRGGLPPNPREALNLGVFKIEEDTGRENASQPAQLVEAQGWIIDENNVVHLVVQSPNTTPSPSWESPAAGCRLQSTSYPSN